MKQVSIKCAVALLFVPTFMYFWYSMEVSYYNINNYLSNVKWILNKHYSGIYGLLKLMFPKAISTDVTTKVIVLDTDLTFLGDIYNLWILFDNFNTKQVIGLVEHQNDSYLGKLSLNHHPWPALQRVFNTGVVLYHMERLKTIGWDSLWTNVIRETLPNLKATDQADQDIINAVIKKNSHLVYVLPCQWNIQLTDYTDSSNCYKNTKAQILHWNSPRKINVINENGESFRAIHKMFLEYNGDILRSLPHCLNVTTTFTNTTNRKTAVDVCYKFNEAIEMKRRTLLYFREFKYNSQKNDVTLVSQLSFDRFHMVEELSKLWDGPMSLTFYLTDSELPRCLELTERSKILRKRLNIAYHAVIKRGSYYVYNELRNISLNNVVTPYVFLVDLDMMPSKYLYQKLKEYLNEMPTMYNKALIVAAFETKNKVPQNKAELLEMLNKRKLFPFHFTDNHLKAYGPTNYVTWRTATEPFKVNWEMHFEPYIIVQSNVTGYDNRFLEYGFDKSSHIMELAAQGYEFLVLPDAFVVHKNHPKSSGLKENEKSKQYRKCLRNRMHAFVADLNRKYNRKYNRKFL